MADEKRSAKRARVESTAPATARAVADAMTDEDDTKTRELVHALDGSRLVNLMQGPLGMVYRLLLRHEQTRLRLAMGKKATTDSKMLNAFRSPVFVLDHEWRRSLSVDRHPDDTTEAEKWLPNQQQRDVLRKLVLSDVWDALEARRFHDDGEQVRKLFAPLKPLVRDLVVRHTIQSDGPTDILPLDIACGPALRSIRVHQYGLETQRWSLGRFVEWMREEKKRSSAFHLTRFAWDSYLYPLRVDDIRELLVEFKGWTQRPTQLTLGNVGFNLALIDGIVEALPDLQSLRLCVRRMAGVSDAHFQRLQKLPLTDLQISWPFLFDAGDEINRVHLARWVLAFPKLQQLTIPTARVTGNLPENALASLTELRQFRGRVEFLPTSKTAWPHIYGLSIEHIDDDDEAERLGSFLHVRRSQWRWVDIDGRMSHKAIHDLVVLVPGCPWRWFHVTVRVTGIKEKDQTRTWTLSHSVQAVYLQGFSLADNWVDMWFSAPRQQLRSLAISTPTLLSLSPGDMLQIARAAPQLEQLSLVVFNAFHVGSGVDEATWCRQLAEWPRRFPRLRCMEISAGFHEVKDRHRFDALRDPGLTELPFVGIYFPFREGQRGAIIVGDPAFSSQIQMPPWIDDDNDEE
jgi:hypothetical protein